MLWKVAPNPTQQHETNARHSSFLHSRSNREPVIPRRKHVTRRGSWSPARPAAAAPRPQNKILAMFLRDVTAMKSTSIFQSWIGIIHDSGRNITCVELEKPYWGLPQLRPHWLSWQLCAMQTAFTISTECLGKHRSSHIRQSGKDAELYRLRRKDIVQRAI
ncbi:hypothetical protein ISCGN_015999 [Ixodes scapularis]